MSISRNLRRETWLDISRRIWFSVGVALCFRSRGQVRGYCPCLWGEYFSSSGVRHNGAVSLLSPLLPAPPKFVFPRRNWAIARQPHALSICPSHDMLPAPPHQPERPALTTTCPVMRKKTLPHRQILLAISTYGNTGSGTWTVEEKTWTTAVAIMSKFAILTQQNQAKSHTAPHDATANHSDWILQSLSASLTSDALRFRLPYEYDGLHHSVFIVTCSLVQRVQLHCLPLNH